MSNKFIILSITFESSANQQHIQIRITGWKYAYNYDDFKIEYNENWCVLTFSAELAEIPTTATLIGNNPVVTGDLLPRTLPTAVTHDGSAIFYVSEYDGKFYKKSLTGSTLYNKKIYFHMIWKHRNSVTS